MANDNGHAERAHSKYSASGSERWLNCAYSVEAEEQSPPSVDNFWSKEGTLAHEVLEAILNRKPLPDSFDVTEDMIEHCERTARKIRALHKVLGGILLVEKKVYAMFIHPEMFGTVDCSIVVIGETLHILDFKYGKNHVVSPEKNTQLIQYALSVAESFDWDFKTVKMWILQPRAGEEWFKSWEITIDELKNRWLPLWHKGVARVMKGNNKPMPGKWCHWCRAKNTCPAKAEVRAERIEEMFNDNPLTNEENNGFQEKSKSEKAERQKSKANPFNEVIEEKAQSENDGEEKEEETECFGCGARFGDNCQCDRAPFG